MRCAKKPSGYNTRVSLLADRFPHHLSHRITKFKLSVILGEQLTYRLSFVLQLAVNRRFFWVPPERKTFKERCNRAEKFVTDQPHYAITSHSPKRKIFPVKVKCCKRTSLISDRGDHFLDGDFTILLFLSSCKRPLDACSVYKQLLVTTHGTTPCIVLVN